MGTYPRLKLVQSDSLSGLESQLNTLLASGWELVGDVKVTPGFVVPWQMVEPEVCLPVYFATVRQHIAI